MVRHVLWSWSIIVALMTAGAGVYVVLTPSLGAVWAGVALIVCGLALATGVCWQIWEERVGRRAVGARRSGAPGSRRRVTLDQRPGAEARSGASRPARPAASL